MRRDVAVEVTLVRHGRTDWNVQRRLQGRTDIPLNTLGRLDATLCGKALAAERWHALYTSPLGRAVETASIIGSLVGLSTQVCDCLIERSFGKLEGSRPGKGRVRKPDALGIEPDSTLRKRALNCLDMLADRHLGERLLVVSHGGFINAFLYLISEGIYGTGRTRLANGSLTVVRRTGSWWQVVSVNQTAHLSDPEGQTFS